MIDEISKLQAGDELDNERLCALFRSSPQGGMRRSIRTNTLIIVSNHVESIYGDRWIGDVLHYTGMGLRGAQTITSTQNRTLLETATNGVGVHLFEVHKARVYTYVGEVVLAEAPYQESQNDIDGLDRKVWVFPVTPKKGRAPVTSAEVIGELDERKARHARRQSDEELAAKAKQSERIKVGVRLVVANRYQRSPWVAEYAKRRAKGHCELCNLPAPFKDKAGIPFLETHHIEWLAKGGADTIENTVALCPNCHRRMHVLDDEKDRQALSLPKELSY